MLNTKTNLEFSKNVSTLEYYQQTHQVIYYSIEKQFLPSKSTLPSAKSAKIYNMGCVALANGLVPKFWRAQLSILEHQTFSTSQSNHPPAQRLSQMSLFKLQIHQGYPHLTPFSFNIPSSFIHFLKDPFLHVHQ